MTAIRQSTARTILVGPILDADGVAKTDEVVANIRITKNGTVGSANGSTTLTHDHAGKYKLAMAAGDSDTVGVLEVSLTSGTNDMPVARLNVIEEAVYDAMYAAGAYGPLQSTTAGRLLDIAVTGEAGVDLGNVTGTLTQANVGWVDADSRIDVGKWLGIAVTLSSNNRPDVNVDEWGDVLLSAEDKFDRNMDLEQHLRGFHTHQGNTYYCAPVGGNDSTGDGSRSLPYKTLQNVIIDLITSGNHDTIIVLADAAPGVTTHTSTTTIVCNKRYFSILGPGRDLIITRSNNGPTFQITADGIELSGFQIGSDGASATSTGVDIVAVDFHRIHNLWFLDTQGDGINCERGSNCKFHDNHFEGTGVAASGQGVHISGAGGPGNANDNEIYRNHFAGTAGTSILIDDGTTDDTSIYENVIHNAGGWGIDITASSDDSQVHNNILGNNSSGNIRSADPTAIIRNNSEWLSPTVKTTAANVQRTLDINTSGESGLDLDNTSGTLNAAQFGGDFITAAKIADGAFVADNFTANSLDGKGNWNTVTPDTSGTAAALHTTTDGLITIVDTVVDGIRAVTDLIPNNGAMSTIGTDTARLTAARAGVLTDWINGGRLDLILDAILTMLDDTRTEPGQGAPPVNPDAMTKLDYLYKAWRNKTTQTAATWSLYNDVADTVDQKATVSDDGTTAIVEEIESGP